MENKQQRPLFLGFSSQKGGVGKSTLAEIVSSILYYEQGINLFVMDCDLSQDSFYKLREREKSIVQESEELSKSMQEYFHHLGKKAYRIYKSAPKEAVRTARSKIDGISNEKYQLVIFDFPGHAGTTELMELSLQMDYILSPIEADIQSLVSCLAYAKTITEIGVSMSDSRIKDIILFWNKVDRRVRSIIIDEYTKLIDEYELTLLPGYVYATHRFSHELSTYGLRGVFRSTYQPPARGLRMGTGLDELVNEIIQRLKLKTKEYNGVVKPVTIPNSFDPSEETESSPATSGEEDNNLEETKETKTAKEKLVDEIEREETGNTEQKRERKPRVEKPGVSSLSIEDYRSLYFHPVRFQMRTAFSINLETLQNLRNVLQDLGERVSIAAYIDNILREHLREHLELLNSAAAKQRRKTTITL